ncbi:MAG: ribosome biogenesis GTPase Der [Candidatus Karelsulcia muelleri]|nr:MAG: ribosome biogenesis GTPase Der [Candidatus Karelsulcia muelleri]
MTKLVSIVGRSNVGKSTLFNRLIGYKKSIVNSKSGVTRDRNYGFCNWNGIDFCLIDTGGYTNKFNNIFDKKICEQFFFALEESDLILFLVDPSNKILEIDYEISNILHKLKKTIYLVINKIDILNKKENISEFFKLGFSNQYCYCISSINGAGTGELLDSIVSIFKKTETDLKKNQFIPKLAIVGRPNVGKSTLINTLLNKNQNIVSNISGTTRDSLEVFYKQFGIECILVDTAGIRKKKKIKENIEFYSVMRAIKSIKNSDVCLLLIDSISGMESQDLNLFQIIENNNKGIILLINKCDLIKKKFLEKNFKKQIKKIIAPFKDVPIFFTSSYKKKNLIKSLKTAIKIAFKLKLKIKTSLLNKIMLPIINKYPHPLRNGKPITIKYCSQLPTYNPQFIFFSNYPNLIKKSYKRFLEKKLREKFNFTGIPIKILFRLK